MHQNPVEELLIGAAPRLHCVLVHGRTLTAAYMREIADTMAVDNIRYLFPQADGNSWYPKGFMEPLSENDPSLSAALDHYEGIVQGLLAQSIAPENIIVGGFSQGACLTAEYLARFPRHLGGAILWTGGLIGPPGTLWQPAPALTGMPVYITTSDVDPFVPAARVRQTSQWLSASGAKVDMEIFAQRDHCVSAPERAAATALLNSLVR